MPAPQPRPRRLPWSSSPSPPALGSRPSAASSGRSFSGPELAPRPARLQISSPAAQDAWGKGVGQQHSPASFCLKRLSRTVEVLGRQGAAAPRLRRRAAELVEGGRVAGGRVAADALRAQAGGLLGRELPEGRGAAPKGALLLELDERGADLPLEQLRIGARSSAGGAELLDPVPLRSNRLGVGPLYQHPRCLVAPLTSAHKRAATTLQRRQTLRPEFPADCVVVTCAEQ